MLIPQIKHTEQNIPEFQDTATIQIQTLAVNAPTTPKIRTETPLGQELDPEVDKYLLEVFKDAYSESLQIIRCESSYDFNAISKTGDYCGFQINQIHFSEFPEGNKIEWIMNYKNCIDFAFKLYQEKKWGHWYRSYSCHKLL